VVLHCQFVPSTIRGRAVEVSRLSTRYSTQRTRRDATTGRALPLPRLSAGTRHGPHYGAIDCSGD